MGSVAVGEIPALKDIRLVKRSERDGEKVIEAGVQTLEELLAICKADLNQWEVESYRPNSWSSSLGADHPPLIHFQVKALLKRKPLADPERLKRDILDQIAEHAPTPRPVDTKPVTDGLLFEPSIYDIHLGKLAHAEECGEEYNLQEAEDLWRRTVDRMLERVHRYPIERVLFALGNDFLHIDNLAGTTTRGTPQDADARLTRIFRSGRKLLVETIDLLRQLAPVKILTVPGNHDHVSTMALGEVMEAWYRQDDRVEVDADPTPQKFERWGDVLLGFTHGKHEKPPQLRDMMSVLRKEDFAECRFLEWHLGHLHKHEETEVGRVMYRRMPSLCATDSWHRLHGYVDSNRAAKCFLWHRELGEYLSFPVSP